MQTAGFIALGELPNDEGYRCWICRRVPVVVVVDLFVPEPKEISALASFREKKTLVMPYRLCPQCAQTKPDEWKIGRLMLERLNSTAAQQ